MRDLVSSSVGPTVRLDFSCDRNLPIAMVDPNQLELAILNLAVNARDAMPDGGTLTLLAEQAAMGPNSSPRLKPGLYVRLSVIDTGCGMDAETIAHAIEPFYSTKEFGRGTGLGLSMVHGLAAQMGGGFLLTSAVGEGTRVDLYLPAAVGVTPAERPHVGQAIAPPGRKLRVLLIDDEDLVRTATAEMLRDLGHHVEEAGGGLEAMARLDSGLKVDAVVTDYRMPGMDGGAVARRVARTHPGVAVLLITGYTGAAEDVLDLPRLSKPFGLAELADTLAKLFADDKVVPFRKRT
jgi:CheY-like chemotaxis protein